MKVKAKISLLTVISSFLFLLTSFVNSNSQNPPITEVRCETAEFTHINSKLKEVIEVECDVCELFSVWPIWNSEGLLEGWKYVYMLGSEPAIFNKIECEYSSNAAHYCDEVVVFKLSGGCSDVFIPCTKEDDEECVND